MHNEGHQVQSGTLFYFIIKNDSAILPDGFGCETKLKTHVDQNCLKIAGKRRKVIKPIIIHLINSEAIIFLEIFCQFSDNTGTYENQWKILG